MLGLYYVKKRYMVLGQLHSRHSLDVMPYSNMSITRFHTVW
jgi:hypothetical protein